VSIARPRPGPDAALVRVRAVGLCGSWLAVLAGMGIAVALSTV
jgi:threonine dehydrogenase-like Zn-dependent dehydrogenase